MKKEIETAQFWARETHTPLFTLTDPNKIEIQNTLILYNAGTSNFYYINQSEKIRSKKGYEYFSKESNFNKYIQETKLIITKIQAFIKPTLKKNYKILTNIELFNEFEITENKILEFFQIYSQTEAYNFKKFENNFSKFNKDFEEIGKIRLEMRRLIKPLFTILIGKIIKETAKRNNLNIEDTFFYTLNEIKDLFLNQKQISKEILNSRKKGYCILVQENRYKIYTNKDYSEISKIIENKFSPKTKTLTGSVACQGKVIGIARVIIQNKQNLKKELSKIKDGEILVTDMTKPEMITYCKKTSAIVTDEGGILCHAAIISREFNIPCIVGTKIATQLIKTGDKIEVDAIKGEIKKIN